MTCKYFLPVGGSLTVSSKKELIFIKSNLSYFSFIDHASDVVSERALTKSKLQRSMFSS